VVETTLTNNANIICSNDSIEFTVTIINIAGDENDTLLPGKFIINWYVLNEDLEKIDSLIDGGDVYHLCGTFLSDGITPTPDSVGVFAILFPRDEVCMPPFAETDTIGVRIHPLPEFEFMIDITPATICENQQLTPLVVNSNDERTYQYILVEL
jgi:hypothetical protein